MNALSRFGLLGSASVLVCACSAEASGPAALQRLSEQGSDCVTGTAAAPTDALYTLSIGAPTDRASVTGGVTLTGSAAGFVNVEVHGANGDLLARVTPDASGAFSASFDTTKLANGTTTVRIDAWDAPAGAPYVHHAEAALTLDVNNPNQSTAPTTPASCQDASGHGIRYFGAYTKNTQTNYDFDAWAGFHQDFLTSFASCGTWHDAASSDWGFDLMQQQPAGENIQNIVCLTTQEDPSLQHVASGMYDDYIRDAANLFLKHGYPNAFIRVGHEFEGYWYPWGLNGGVNDGDYAGFIAAFRHVAQILKATSPTFTIIWNPGCSYFAESMKSELAYPGDDVVDVIGVDCYDDGTGVSHLIDGGYGMNWWAQFAAQHGKPIALPEWGLMRGGDNPSYVQAMFDFMKTHDTFLESFWDSDDGDTKSQLSTGEAPSSGATFLQTFSAYAKSCHP